MMHLQSAKEENLYLPKKRICRMAKNYYIHTLTKLRNIKLASIKKYIYYLSEKISVWDIIVSIDNPEEILKSTFLAEIMSKRLEYEAKGKICGDVLFWKLRKMER